MKMPRLLPARLVSGDQKSSREGPSQKENEKVVLCRGLGFGVWGTHAMAIEKRTADKSVYAFVPIEGKYSIS
jgi:hypothetical protein